MFWTIIGYVFTGLIIGSIILWLSFKMADYREEKEYYEKRFEYLMLALNKIEEKIENHKLYDGIIVDNKKYHKMLDDLYETRNELLEKLYDFMK